MKREHRCPRPEFISMEHLAGSIPQERPPFPDILTDCLTGLEIPFSNRDNIRQKALRFLLEERGYRKEDLRVDREVLFDLEGQQACSPVDIAVTIGGKTLILWKCSSGSLVSRERQIIASARLLEEYVVPFAVVTNGEDLELLDAVSEKVKGCGFQSVPSRQELLSSLEGLVFRRMKSRKIIYEQRILHTYDGIACPSSFARIAPLSPPEESSEKSTV
jgi:hypothetical protein